MPGQHKSPTTAAVAPAHIVISCEHADMSFCRTLRLKMWVLSLQKMHMYKRCANRVRRIWICCAGGCLLPWRRFFEDDVINVDGTLAGNQLVPNTPIEPLWAISLRIVAGQHHVCATGCYLHYCHPKVLHVRTLHIVQERSQCCNVKCCTMLRMYLNSTSQNTV